VPTYEYRCPDGHEFEHFFRTISSASAELECPTCGKKAERKVSGGSALLFKGSGFYITDYGKDGKKDLRAGKTGSDRAASGSEGGESGSGGTSDSRPGAEAPKSTPEKKSGE
jgi:putative FmdB family regulatory protein